MSTGKTDGTGRSHSPVTCTAPASDAQKTGRTSTRNTVHSTQPRSHIPNVENPGNDKQLSDRQTKEVKVFDSPLATFMAWIRRRPKPSDLQKIVSVAHEFAIACGASEGSSAINAKNGRITLFQSLPDENRAERKALMFLAMAGVVRIKGRDPFGSSPSITFKLIRPRNLEAQLQRARLLLETLPSDLPPNQMLDWERIMQDMPPFTGNNLKMSGVIIRDERSEYVHNFDGRISQYRCDQSCGTAEKRFDTLQQQWPELQQGSPAAWLERFKQLDRITSEKSHPLIKRAINALKKPVTRETLNELMAIERTLSNINSAMADEIKSANRALYGNPALKLTPEINRLDGAGLSPIGDHWQEIKPFLDALGLLHSPAHISWFETLQERYGNILPFNLKGLANEAALLSKEKLATTHRQQAKLENTIDEKLFSMSVAEGLAGRARDRSQKARDFEDVKDALFILNIDRTDPISNREIAQHLLKKKPVTQLDYNESHWRQAYQTLRQRL